MSDHGPVVLSGRRVVVTGAAGGIGSAIVRKLEESGAGVFATDVTGTGSVLRCDVSSENDVATAFREAASSGAVTDVVHAAGICTTAPVADLELADWARILDVNLTGAFLVGRAAARTLPDGGNLVFIASVAGLTGDPFFWSVLCEQVRRDCLDAGARTRARAQKDSRQCHLPRRRPDGDER